MNKVQKNIGFNDTVQKLLSFVWKINYDLSLFI